MKNYLNNFLKKNIYIIFHKNHIKIVNTLCNINIFLYIF